MSRLLEIQERLLDTSAEITRLERALAERQSRALASSLKSLYKLRSGLEVEFNEAAASAQVDVISYRLFEGHQRPTMALVGRAMDSFQTLYAILYSAVAGKKPKDTAHLSAEAIRQSSFEFAYAYAGSAGFVFTMPNDRLLFGETKLDEAMGHLFRLAKVSTSDDVRHLAKSVGFAAVRAVYNWANALGGAGSGADIQWKKDDSTKGTLLLQPAEVRAIRDLIAFTSDLEVDETTFSGILLGYDSKTLRFRFDPLDGGLMSGKIVLEADIPVTVQIPWRYAARIRTLTKIRYAVEEADIRHELLSLRPIN